MKGAPRGSLMNFLTTGMATSYRNTELVELRKANAGNWKLKTLETVLHETVVSRERDESEREKKRESN